MSRPFPPNLPPPDAVMARAGGENFAVASRVLPRRTREHLLAVYGFARLVDEVGDATGNGAGGLRERIAALTWLETEVARARNGKARHPLLVRLQATMHECGLLPAPFLRLIEANRLDQHVLRYATWQRLLGYCHFSADPVGELVLGVFGRATYERVALSDKICTALQLAEHWQDVAEDFARGRIYLPGEDMKRFGCEEDDLRQPSAGWRVRGLIAFEVARARAMLEEGVPLLRTLGARERVAVAAFVSGGRAALEAIERAGYDVLAGPPRASRACRAAALIRTLAEHAG